MKKKILVLLGFIAIQSLVNHATAQERFSQILQQRHTISFFNEIHFLSYSKDSLAFQFSFRVSHNQISFLHSSDSSNTEWYKASITINLELHFSDSSITRYSETFLTSVSDFEQTQSRTSFLTNSIKRNIKSKPIYYLVDLIDNNNQKSILRTPFLKKLQTFSIPNILYYTVLSNNNYLVNLSDNFLFNTEQNLILELTDTTHISKWNLSLSKKDQSEDKYETVSDFDPIKLEVLSNKNGIFNTAVLLPSLKMELGNYKLTITYLNKKDEIVFDNLWLDMPASLTDLDLATRVVRYITTDDEYDDLTSGNFKTRTQKFKAYWKKKDPTPNTIYNELMAEYYTRVDFAFINYSSLKDYGWRTDRGKIYILYGEPSNKQRIFPPGEPSEEIWIYSQLNKKFVFIDADGKGEFRLLPNKKK